MLPRWLKPKVLIAVAVVVVIAVAIASQRRRDDSTGDPGLSAGEFMRIAQSDRSLPSDDAATGREAFRERINASQGVTMTFEIPPGMTIYAESEIAGGSVHLLLDPAWTDPAIVELSEGSTTRVLITNGSQNDGKITIRSTPIGDVEGSLTLYAE